MDPTQGQGNIDERLSAYHAEEPKSEVSVEEPKQPEPMPSSETKTVENKQVTEPEVDSDLDLPEEASERTKAQFEKLKARLKEERSKNQNQPQPKQEETVDFGNSAFDIFHEPGQAQQQPVEQNQFPYLNQQQIQNAQDQFIDANGNVDVDGLNRALAQANKAAYDANQRYQTLEQRLARIEESSQVKEAHAEHPEIDPLNKEKFNPGLYEMVRDRILRNKFMGVNQTLAQVAAEIKRSSNFQPSVNVGKAREEAVTEYKQSQEARNQGPLEPGRGEKRTEGPTLDQLRKQTRGHGPQADAALSQRLKALGI